MCFLVRSLNLSNNLLNGSVPALNALTALTYVVRRIVCGVLESSAEAILEAWPCVRREQVT